MNSKYKTLIKKVLKYGTKQEGRNGNTLIVPHYSFILDLGSNVSHICTLRKTYYKGVEGEFKTFIDDTPLTNVSQFEANGCNYWKLWSEDDGSINVDYHNMMHPQLENIISDIQQNPNSRRHHIELWNPDNVRDDSLSLPCCWHGLTFTVINDVLHLKWTQRSVDVLIGLPADIYLSYMFMRHIAGICNLKIGTCMYSLSNVHVYEEHIPGAIEILKRNKTDYDKPISFKLKE